MRLNAESIGCLLLGETKRMRVLSDMLIARGMTVVHGMTGGDLLASAQEGLYTARTRGGVCIAAEGELWAAALALAAQLCVERIVLIAPTDFAKAPENDAERQLERLKGFVRRNLFFCVAEVLVLEERSDSWSDRRIDSLCRGMCNARVHRLSFSDQRWTNCEHSPIEASARFLGDGDFVFSLAK